MSDPWSGIIGMIVGAGARNMAQTKAGADKSEKETYGVYNSSANRPPGLQMGQAPAMESGARSPTAQLMQVVGVPYQVQMNSPVGGALKGEEAMLRNTTPAVGGFVQGPAKVNSDFAPYGDSSLPDYMKKRGGFSL
jgi:hypothetical protein